MPPHPTELFLRTVLARAYPRVIGQFRERSWVFFDIVIPLLNTVGAVLLLVSHATSGLCERQARQRGVIDNLTADCWGGGERPARG